ncbi:MAG: hypothetical protein VXW84_15430, partial [Verrucomicrobiota bacterium]|nr:hypothetical protein [Verrucomicrobiota bacterium]
MYVCLYVCVCAYVSLQAPFTPEELLQQQYKVAIGRTLLLREEMQRLEARVQALEERPSAPVRFWMHSALHGALL